jgi:hypothetical protein
MYWLHGSIILAAHDSAAEEMLLQQGGILVASLLFTPDPRETTRRDAVVDRVATAAVAADSLLDAVVN